jgi:DNA-binding transcriptional MerR regulator
MKFLTRKEVAERLGVSVDTVRRNEQRFGLRRIRHNRKVVLYRDRDLVAYERRCGLEGEFGL